MKFFLLITAACFLSNYISAQSKMEIFIKDKKCDILGYAMDPDGTGDKSSMSILGAMQSVQPTLQMSYFDGGPINNVQLFIAAPNADNTLIKFGSITVYAIKENLSSYNNGACIISSSGNAIIELKCKFTHMIMQQGPSVKEPVITKVRVNEEPLNLNTKTEQKWDTPVWEILPDPTIKGVGGEISMQIPKGLGGRTHMEFYEAGDYKNRVASWFDNNKERLLPGLYNVVIDSRDTIKNVPVELGKQTRLKMGVFSVSGYRGQTIENSSTHQKFTYSAPFSILLPEGTYYLNGNKKTPIVIKDGVLTEL